jgi:hypothetical protein
VAVPLIAGGLLIGGGVGYAALGGGHTPGRAHFVPLNADDAATEAVDRARTDDEHGEQLGSE